MAKHILLAEDSVTMQKVIEMTFAGEDVTLTMAATVDEALARARQRRPDLVLADLSLAGKNGYDLASAIKNEDRAIPVLLLHGAAAQVDPQRVMRSGADGQLVKPFETQELIDRVNALLEGTDAIGMSGPVEPLGEPLSAATMAPAGAPAAAASPRPASPQRQVGVAPALGAVSTAPGAGSRVVLPPDAAPVARPPVAPAPVVPRPPVAPAPVAPRPPAAAPAPVAPRPPAAAPAPVAPRPPAAPAAVTPRPPLVPRPPAVPATGREIPPPVAVGLEREPTALEITIEAEPPPAVVDEPLPSFDLAVTTEVGRASRGEPVRDAASAPRPLRTLAGWGDGLPPPPPGMALPPGLAPAAAAAGGQALPGSAASGAARELDPAVYEAIVKLSREVIERVAWEVVPELAETIIREQLDRVLAQRSK